MTSYFGTLPTGDTATLYSITNGKITTCVTNYGATLVRLLVPDTACKTADVVLGYDDCNGYRTANGACLGATVGRNANRLKGAVFSLNAVEYPLSKNDGKNNLHSGPDYFHLRLWNTVACTDSSVTFELFSPDGDQGFPGNTTIQVTYKLDHQNGLHIIYEAVSDQDTVFNMTNHSYFNLAGHENTDAAMQQMLTLPSRFFQDIETDYEPLHLQAGYDHNWEVFCSPCAILEDPVSGRSMAVYTDCPGIQVYTGNFLNESGKNGVHYGKRSGVALETQFYPDALHHPDWPQPITKAGQHYHSETVFIFSW